MKTQLFAAGLLAATEVAAVYHTEGGGAYIVEKKENHWGKFEPDPNFKYDGKFKYVFALRPESNVNRCTATMISPNVAITAAHCIIDGTEGQ